jgi:hypothetical protein
MSFQKKIKTKSGTYVIEVQGYRDDQGKVKHRYIRYLGKLDEEGNLIPRMKIENTQVKKVTLSGPVHALHEISEEIRLQDILGEYAPEILTLVYAHILRPESLNNIKRVLNWIDTDEIGLEVPVSRKRFESAMDNLAKMILPVERQLYQRITRHSNLNTLFYDVTSIYFYGKKVSMARLGYNSRHTSLPQVGIGLAVESDYGIPLFHHLFDGNVFDAKTFPVILGRLQEIGRENCTLVFDRGISSRKNIRAAVKSGFTVIASLPIRGKKMKEMAQREVQTLGPQDICPLSSVFIHAREINPTWEELPVRMFICLNKPLQAQIQQNRYYEVQEAVERIQRGSPIKCGLRKYVREDGTINTEALRERESLDGVYILITTHLEKNQVVKKYFERELIEKSFRFLKSTLSVQPVRHWLFRRVKAHIFICYLAYLHLAWMKMLLEKGGISLSPIKALELLETIYTVELTDTHTEMSTKRTVPLTKEQEGIYKALHLLS